MGKSFRDLKIPIIVLCIVVSAIVIKQSALHLFSISGFACQMDKTISQAHSHDIITFLHEQKQLRSFSLQKLSDTLKQQFPLVRSIKLNQQASGILHLQIDFFSPQLIVNQDYILADCGLLFDTQAFSSQTVSGCPAITIKSEKIGDKANSEIKEGIARTCKNILSLLPKACFAEYNIVWEDATKSWLYDKKNNNFAIVFNDFKIPNQKILSACNHLRKQLKHQESLCNEGTTRWIADIRFKDQIVLFNEDRGR